MSNNNDVFRDNFNQGFAFSFTPEHYLEFISHKTKFLPVMVDIRVKSEISAEETKLKNWFITQLFAIQAGVLDEWAATTILKFMEANTKNPKLQEWFMDFEKIKTNLT